MKTPDWDVNNRKTARPIRLVDHERLNLVLIGCGGNGSHIAEGVVRVAKLLRDKGRDVDLVFIDPDHVEPGNIPRQCFSEAEIGVNKAQVLALRYSAKWGIPIKAIPDYFEKGSHTYKTLTLYIGCVDNPTARAKISQTLHREYERVPSAWWLDLGNGLETGQVVLGSANLVSDLQQAFNLSSVCIMTPSAGLLHPELLNETKEPVRQKQQHTSPEDTPQSCGQLALTNAQMPVVNQMTAAIGATMLTKLLVTQDLKYWASYFDLSTGKQVSYAASPQAIEDALVNVNT